MNKLRAAFWMVVDVLGILLMAVCGGLALAVLWAWKPFEKRGGPKLAMIAIVLTLPFMTGCLQSLGWTEAAIAAGGAIVGAGGTVGTQKLMGDDSTLGNGQIDVAGKSIPVSAVADALDKVKPGLGDVVRQAEAGLQGATGNAPATVPAGFVKAYKFEVTLKEGASVPAGQRVIAGDLIDRLYVYPFWVVPTIEPISYTPNEIITGKLPVPTPPPVPAPASNAPPAQPTNGTGGEPVDVSDLEINVEQ